MIASAVVTAAQVESRLKELGYERTTDRTETGQFWKRKQDGRIQQVPDSIDGFYPTWLLEELEKEIGKINAWDRFRGSVN